MFCFCKFKICNNKDIIYIIDFERIEKCINIYINCINEKVTELSNVAEYDALYN